MYKKHLFRNSLFLIGASLVINGCGGQSVPGGSANGFYSMSLNLDGTTIISPAYDPSLGTNPPFPPDQITGKITFNYSGPTNTTPLDGYLENAEVCLLSPVNKCYTVPLAGVVKVNSDQTFKFPLITHKYEAPWIVLNPVEDRSLVMDPVKVQIGTGDGVSTTFGFSLPSNSISSDGGTNIYGSEVNVYRNGGFSCSLTNQVECNITKNGQNLTITFTNPPANGDIIELQYSVYKSYNFNPSVDANATGHLWNGKNYAEVNATLNIRLKLYDGTHLDAKQNITFQVIPAQNI